jgi:HK97 family phage major capsid protein
MTRDVTTGGSGANLVGRKVRQTAGVIGWSAVVNSGAVVLGPFRDSDVMVYHDSALPPVNWLPEIGAVVAANPTLTGTVLTPKRICGQVIVSRKLFVQSTGSQPLDDFLASRFKLACSSVLDQACLYGQGSAQNQPLGILNVRGANHVATSTPIVWADLAALRLASSDHDADSSEYFITNPIGRKTFETTQRFTGSALTIRDSVKNETEFSKQLNDNRVFAGLWNYLVIATWGAGTDDFTVDLTIDPFSQATSGRVIITASMFCDVAVR